MEQVPKDIRNEVFSLVGNVGDRRLINKEQHNDSKQEFLSNPTPITQNELTQYEQTCPSLLVVIFKRDDVLSIEHRLFGAVRSWVLMETRETASNTVTPEYEYMFSLSDRLRDEECIFDVKIWYFVLRKRNERLDLGLSDKEIKFSLHTLFEKAIAFINDFYFPEITLYVYFMRLFNVLGLSFERYGEYYDDGSSSVLVDGLSQEVLGEMKVRIHSVIDKLDY